MDYCSWDKVWTAKTNKHPCGNSHQSSLEKLNGGSDTTKGLRKHLKIKLPKTTFLLKIWFRMGKNLSLERKKIKDKKNNCCFQEEVNGKQKILICKYTVPEGLIFNIGVHLPDAWKSMPFSIRKIQTRIFFHRMQKHCAIFVIPTVFPCFHLLVCFFLFPSFSAIYLLP